MTTATNSSFSSGADSQIGGRMKQSSSSFNPVYNSVSVSIDPPQSSLYEELPQAHVNHKQEHIPTSQQPPPFSSFSTGRITTNNTIYASSGGHHLHTIKSSTQVYQYDHPPDIAYVDKQSGCVFTCEAAILVMGLLVVLLAGAALTMSLLLWFQVISVQTAVVSTSAPTTPVPGDCPCATLLAQRGSYMTLLNKVQNVQIELDALTNETAQNSTELRLRLDQLFDQLENSTKFIESNLSRPIPSSSPSTVTFESLQECVDDTEDVCTIQANLRSLCGGAFDEIADSELNVLTEFSCYLRPVENHGPVNGSVYVQPGYTPPLGSYTPQKLDENAFKIGCSCFLYEEYPVPVECMRTSIRCPSQVANIPATFTI